MNVAERAALPELSTRDIVRITAEWAVLHATHAYLEQQYQHNPDAMHLDDLIPQLFLGNVAEATGNRCAYMSSLLGNFLTVHAERFANILLIQTKVTKDTPEGAEAAKAWNFDTWLLVRDVEGRYIVCSPAIHQVPLDDLNVPMCESDTIEGALAGIQEVRPHWQILTAKQVRQFMTTHDTSPASFCTIMDEEQRLCTYTAVSLVPGDERPEVSSDRKLLPFNLYEYLAANPE